jgi:chromosome segregation ATPase
MNETNPDLAALQRTLGDLVDTLAAKQEQATDVATITALDTQIRETAFRATQVQQLLFHAQTAAISAAVDEVDKAKGELDKAIAQIERLNAFIQTVTSFLGLVDKVIGVAKLV